MKKARNVAIIGALVWIILKMVVLNIGLSREWYLGMVMANMLIMLVVIFLSLHYSRSKESAKESAGFLSDFKQSMRSGSIYAIIVFVFMLAYYSGIDKEYTETRKKEFIELAETMDFEAIKELDPVKSANYSRDDAIAEQKETAEWIFSPFFICTLALVGMIVLCLFYSLFATVFYRKVLTRLR